MKGYSKYYSETSLFEKIRQFASIAGQRVIYQALLLFYMLKDKNIDLKTKFIITAALGYFIFPADLIPDLAPVVGFTDDLSVLLLTLTRVARKMTPEIQENAKHQAEEWFKKQ